MDQGGGAPWEAVGQVGNGEPVQNGGSDVCRKKERSKESMDLEILYI